jgi:hypothetical protein
MSRYWVGGQNSFHPCEDPQSLMPSSWRTCGRSRRCRGRKLLNVPMARRDVRSQKTSEGYSRSPLYYRVHSVEGVKAGWSCLTVGGKSHHLSR